jgi:DNA repair exonuclease SbcCD ATPase subunit
LRVAVPKQEAMTSLEAVETNLSAPVANASQSALPQEMPKDLYSNGKTKLIKTLNYKFEVENITRTSEAIEAAVKKYPAYISDSKMRLENPLLENEITIRVQNEFFQDLVKDIDPLAKFVNYRTITTDDVAKEFVDLESRLKTKREVEQRYAEILRKKAGTITELLEAEQKIGELHEEIEATVSRINYLKDQVSYSTINLEFYQTITQKIAEAETNSTGKEFKDALSAGLNGIVSFAIVLAYIWPLIALGIITGTFYWFRKRRSITHA